MMIVECTCYRLYENERGFDDFEFASKYDGTFETMEEAVRHMHDVCGLSSTSGLYTFDVTIWEEDP